MLGDMKHNRKVRASAVRDAVVRAREAQSEQPESPASPESSVEQKLAAIRTATAFSFPTGDIDSILTDIERGSKA
jgi:hypothetical protein